jgi:DNA-binding transcriptional ArsR family regulator
MTVTATLEVLATPTRRHILDALRDGEQTVNQLVRRLELNQPAVSKQLKILRDAGLVTVRPDGQRRVYQLRAAPLAELAGWLAPYRQLWETSLDKLEDALDNPHPTPLREKTR